jgi:2-desacetyl-2-hydroxyethyl bacteriochlorophyllide A dehydrogenase
MLALVKESSKPREAAVTEVPDPQPGDDDVVIAVEACGICGSDLTFYDDPESLAKELGITFPVLFGHEFAGRITYVGANVADLAVGDLVTANPHLFCGVCRFCREDRPEICENRPIIGWHRPGGFAELVAVRASNVYPLSPAIPATVAALGEPLAVGVHAVRRADFEPGSVALVIGPGPIGLLIGLACQEAGAKRVVVAGLGADAMRLDVARSIGLETAVIGDPASVGRLNQNLERDVSVTVFEASGAPAGIRTALELAPKDGKVLVLGIPHDLVPINIAALAFAEKQLIGCRGFAPRDWTRSVEIIERRTEDLGRLVTSKLPLADHDVAFQSLRERTAIKIMLSAKPHS